MNQFQLRCYWFLVLTVFHLSSTHVSCQPEVDDHLIYKRAPQMGFQGMRGKKDTSEDQSSEGGNILLHNSDFDKRVPGMGFQGMRGKKLYEYTEYDPIKRAPMMGFQGVRGKKDMEILNSGDIPYDKRIPGGNGFHGMRGKKDSDELNYFNLEHYLNDLNAMSEEKRAPSDGFFGMRGKKAPSFGSGFFGMRGKKYPYEFRGKFVGVRGKKMFSDNEIGDDEDILASVMREEEYKGKPIDFNQLMSLLAENTEHNDILWEKRRGPQGFFGMRGKRSVK